MRITKYIIIICGIFLVSPLFADEIPFDGGQQPPAKTANQQPQAATPSSPTTPTTPPTAMQKMQQTLQQGGPPVVQIPQSGLVAQQQPSSTANLTAEQRLGRLEQQFQNYNQMNLPQKIINLQQQLQKLSGQVTEQAHILQQLTKQLQAMYQNLDQRVKQIAKPQQQTSPATPTQTAPTTPSTGSPNIFSIQKSADKSVYDAAFSLLMANNYQQAFAKMQEYLQKYPDGRYAVNAHYWLGEIYYRQLKFDQAKQSFQNVVKNYPNSGKVPDAKYKLAMIDIAQGNQQQAQQELMGVVKQYPNSAAANLARQQLTKLGGVNLST